MKNVSKSTISRQFIATTQQLAAEFLSRSLEDERYVVVFIDGKEYGTSQVIVAVGVDEMGYKHVLGLWEGVTESKEVCKAFLEDLTERGLRIEEGLLVIDGGKGLRAAIESVWGEKAVVQRCQCHKKRNVLDKLPESKRKRIGRLLSGAWSKVDAAEARQALHHIAWQLEQEGEERAAASVREGLEETLTCIKLGLPSKLQESLKTTNIIESAFSQCESLSDRVKRWRNGNQVVRWAVAGLMKAEKSFGRIRGARAFPKLVLALRNHLGAAKTVGVA